MRFDVFDLGAHEVLAQFMRREDAEAWALAKSVNGPALRVRAINRARNALFTRLAMIDELEKEMN